MFAITGYEIFYFLFDKKLTLLNLLLINLLVFYVAILFGIITIILAKITVDVFVYCKHFKEFYYYIFFLKLSDLGGFNELFAFLFRKLYIIIFLIFFTFICSSIQYIYIKDENNSSVDVCSQFSGFFELFFKYLSIFSIILFFILVFIKF